MITPLFKYPVLANNTESIIKINKKNKLNPNVNDDVS